jgi:hypothetical protein
LQKTKEHHPSAVNQALSTNDSFISKPLNLRASKDVKEKKNLTRSKKNGIPKTKKNINTKQEKGKEPDRIL